DDRSDDLPEPLHFAQSSSGAVAPIPGRSLFPEPRLLTSAFQAAIDRFGESGKPKEGWYPEFSNMITGSGFISVGPGYRKYVLNRQAFIDGSGAVSWHAYKMVQGRFEAPDLGGHFTLG